MSKKRISLQTYILTAGILAVAGLAIFNMRDILFGAPLSLTAPRDGSSVASDIFPISGIAKHADAVTVDGGSIPVDQNGAFSDEVILSPGYNVVQVALLDRFGRETVKTLHIVEQSTPALAEAPSSTIY